MKEGKNNIIKANVKRKGKVLLDTNVLIYDTESITKFGDKEVLLSSVVLEELDSFKGESTERGFYSREVSRRILQLLESEENKGKNLTTGIKVNDVGGVLKRIDSKTSITKSNDLRILEDAKENNARLIVRDTNLYLLANGIVDVEYYEADSIKNNDIYKGYRNISLNGEDFQDFISSKEMDNLKENPLYPNEFALITNGSRHSLPKGESCLIGICKGDKIKFLDLDNILQKKYNGLAFRPKNLEQKLLMYLILDEDIKLVTIMGASGKGKTALAVDYARNAVEKGCYEKYVYAKSVMDEDKDESLGFLKGGLVEKMLPSLQPLNCTLESIIKVKRAKSNRNNESNVSSKNKSGRDTNENDINSLFESMELAGSMYLLGELNTGKLDIVPLAKLRGITLENKAIILDEAQNLKKNTMKTFISRIGNNSKIFVTGDNEQIDDRNLTKYNNGFTHLIEQGKTQDFISHITMDITEETQRGDIAKFANQFL